MDYDRDGKANIAVFRSVNGTWYLLRSSQGFTAVQFGAGGDNPLAADNDENGKADVAMFRPLTSAWYLLRSQAGFAGFGFGISSDVPASTDFDGDGKPDVAVFSDGNWYLINSVTNQFQAVQFGISNYKAVPAAFVP